ncbi:MAG: efflux RND transporter periplasmic adaptor subunit [Akkermansiaceae bacterium]
MKKKNFGVLLGIIVVAVAGWGSWRLIETAPTQQAEDKPKVAKSVQVVKLVAGDQDVSVVAYGNVVPAREVKVGPEVSGRVISHHDHLVPGGRIAEGEVMFEIDPADYEVELRDAQSVLAEAQSDVDLEEGRQAVALREFEQLRKDLPGVAINEDLVLRKPFKARTEAAMDRAMAAVAMAELKLRRTQFKVPFNAVVLDETVEVGQMVDSGKEMGTLVGSDAYWIHVSVPLQQLKWVKVPDPGSEGPKAVARLVSGDGEDLTWEGRVVRLLGGLEEQGRMAKVVVEIPDPLDANPKQQMLLGSYLQVDIDAGVLENVIEIPRAALREGDRIWLVGDDHKLVIHDADILWRKENAVVIRNDVKPGEHLVVSDLRAPVPGMAVVPEMKAMESNK